MGDFKAVALGQADRALGAVELDQRFGKRLFRELGGVADVDDRRGVVFMIEQNGCDILALDLGIDPFGAGRE